MIEINMWNVQQISHVYRKLLIGATSKHPLPIPFLSEPPRLHLSQAEENLEQRHSLHFSPKKRAMNRRQPGAEPLVLGCPTGSHSGRADLAAQSGGL